METPTNPNRPPLDPLETLDHILKESQKLREKGERILQTTAWPPGKSKTDFSVEELKKEPVLLEPGK